MNKRKFQEVSLEERIQMLKANCDSADTIDYTKEYTEEEIREMETDLKDKTIQRLKLEEELTEFKQEIKGKMKPLSKIIGGLLTGLRYGSRGVKEKCFKFIEGTKAYYYNEEGVCVYERPLLPEERQGKLFVSRNDDFDKAANF
jgi:predicted RNase H-like nuclease (RuvC/YqgF family)